MLLKSGNAAFPLEREQNSPSPQHATLMHWSLELKWLQKQQVEEGALTLFVPRKAGNTPPARRVPSLHLDSRQVGNSGQEIEGQEGCIHKPYYFFPNFLPHSQTPLLCQSFINVLFPHLKDVNVSSFGPLFESYFMSSYSYKIRFGLISPINLFYVNLIIKSA